MQGLVGIVLTPAGAILGSYLAARVTSAKQLDYERLVEAVDHFTPLLYELVSDYFLWVTLPTTQQRIYTGRVIEGKRHLLYSYRTRYAVRLDKATRDALNSVIAQLGEHYADVFNSYQGYFHVFDSNVNVADLPENHTYERAVEQTKEWLDSGLQDALTSLETEFGRRVGAVGSPWWRRLFTSSS